MAHYAVISPTLASHLAVHGALATGLIKRGHRITFLGPPDMRHRIPETRVDFEPLGRDSHPEGHVDRAVERMGRMRGPLGLRGLILGLAADTEMICRDAPDVLSRIAPDALISDQMEPGGSLAAEALAIPRITLASALPANREPGIPPPFVGWRFDDSERGVRRNAGAWRVTDWLMRPQSEVLRAWCRRYGLPVRHRLSDWVSPLCDISQTVPALDFPRAMLPATFHYVGPIRLSDSREMPIESGGRPIVFGSLGTLQGGRFRLMQAIARACDDAGACLVLAHCGRLSPREVARLPGSAIVRDYVPQGAVLAQAAAAVTHGGLNTVLDAVMHRVPMIVVPLAFEQPAIAARLKRAGVAEIVAPRRASRRNLRIALARVLERDSYRSALRRPAAEIARSGGVEQAADLAEAMLAASAAIGPKLRAPFRVLQ